MYDTIIRRDGTVVWRRGEDAGEPIYCTHCGNPVLALTKQQISDGMVDELENIYYRRSVEHGYHLVDRRYNDIGGCKLS